MTSIELLNIILAKNQIKHIWKNHRPFLISYCRVTLKFEFSKEADLIQEEKARVENGIKHLCDKC